MGLDSCLSLRRASGRKRRPASGCANGISSGGSSPGLGRHPVATVAGVEVVGVEIHSGDSLSPLTATAHHCSPPLTIAHCRSPPLLTTAHAAARGPHRARVLPALTMLGSAELETSL